MRRKIYYHGRKFLSIDFLVFFGIFAKKFLFPISEAHKSPTASKTTGRAGLLTIPSAGSAENLTGPHDGDRGKTFVSPLRFLSETFPMSRIIFLPWL